MFLKKEEHTGAFELDHQLYGFYATRNRSSLFPTDPRTGVGEGPCAGSMPAVCGKSAVLQ